MSTTSRLLETIENLSEDDVRADLARVRAARERLELEESLLVQVLDLVITGPKSPVEGMARTAHLARLRAERNAVVHAPSAGGKADAERGTTRPRRQNRRAAIRAIIRSDPKRDWTPAEIDYELVLRGVETTRDAVRMTLQRMTKAGELVRTARGLYKLPRDTEAKK